MADGLGFAFVNTVKDDGALCQKSCRKSEVKSGIEKMTVGLCGLALYRCSGLGMSGLMLLNNVSLNYSEG